MNTAEQVRQLGIRVGDTIEGWERGENWSHVARLTLLWVGDEIAVFRYVEKSSRDLDWSSPHETGNLDLGCRDWKKLTPKLAGSTGREERIKTESDKGDSAKCLVGDMTDGDMALAARSELQRLNHYNFDPKSFRNGFYSGCMHVYGLTRYELAQIKDAAEDLCNSVFDRMSEEKIRPETRVKLLKSYKRMRNILNAQQTGGTSGDSNCSGGK